MGWNGAIAGFPVCAEKIMEDCMVCIQADVLFQSVLRMFCLTSRGNVRKLTASLSRFWVMMVAFV